MKVRDYACHYWETYGYANRDLIFYLTGAFSDFLDMYLINKILQLQSDSSFSTIVICAGGSHTSNISGALKELGYRELGEPIAKPYS